MKREYRTALKPRGRKGFKTIGKTMADQSFKKECDINSIIKRYKMTGQVPNMATKQFYGDASQIPDLQTALDTQLQAKEAFMDLPSDVRKKFKNNPFEILEWLKDPANEDEAIKLGIVNPKPVEVDTSTETPVENVATE